MKTVELVTLFGVTSVLVGFCSLSRHPWMLWYRVNAAPGTPECTVKNDCKQWCQSMPVPSNYLHRHYFYCVPAYGRCGCAVYRLILT